GGGNTANLLAIWRVHGVDRALREVWERGGVLGGWSAGGICWFEDGVTDSFGPQLRPLGDGLGFLSGSFCPHYDGEPERRPTYTRLVRDGALPPGLAADDDAALHFEGTELVEVVSQREGARGYEVTPDGEEPLETRQL
ncbi:MAG: peptidase E, partial [Thermoleophilia bacterium]|nr:peptidase E [Thermoleophilia bacterium]